MQGYAEPDLQAGCADTTVTSSAKRRSVPRRKVTIRLSEKLHERLEIATERPGFGKSAIIETALGHFLEPDPSAGKSQADFDDLHLRFDRLERDVRMIAETIALHARYHLAIMPPLPRPQQRKATLLGDQRFKVLAEQVDRRVRLGRPLIQETIDRLKSTDQLASEECEGVLRGPGHRDNDACLSRQIGQKALVAASEGGSKSNPANTAANSVSQGRSLPKWRLILSVFLPFAAGYFLAYLFRTISASISPALASTFALDAADIGLLASVYFLVFGIAQIPLGILLDRYGPRRVQAVLLVVAAGGATLFGTASSFPELVLGRAMIGLGVAGSLMAGLKAIVTWFPRERTALLNGWMIMLGSLGAVTATAPAEWLLMLIGWRDLFEALTIATIAVGGLIYIVVPERAAVPETIVPDRKPATLRSIFLDHRFIRIAPLSAACIGSSWALQSLWASAWLRDVEGMGQHDRASQLFWMAIGLSFGALLLGALADHLRKRNVSAEILLAGVATLFLAAELLLVFRAPLPSLLPWSAVSVTGAATVLSFAVIADYFPKEVAARGSGALNLLHFGWAFAVQYGIGFVVGHWPALDGHYPTIAYQYAFGLTLAFQAAALIWFALPWLGRLGRSLYEAVASTKAEQDQLSASVWPPGGGGPIVEAQGSVEW